MKLRIKLHRKVSLEALTLFLAVFCICSYALLEHVSVSISVFSAVKFPLLIVGGLCLLTKTSLLFGNIKKKKYFYILSSLILLCGGLVIVAVVNRIPTIGTDPMRATIRLVLFLIELFWLMIWIAETGKEKYIMNFLFCYVLILAIATDVLFFTRAIVFYSGRHENYLIGTKFSVAYLHMDLLTLWFVRNNMRLYREGKTKWFAFLATLFILAVSIRVDCMTGAIGCIALCIFFMMLNTRLQKQFMRFRSPGLLLLFLLASVIFPFIAERIMSIPAVGYLVTSILGRDDTLTGRLGIFGSFGDKMEGHWLQGYGFGNGNAAAEWLFACANAQNALLQWVLQVGVPVTFLLIVFMLLIFRQLSKSPKQKQILPMVVLVYVYIVLGLVETTLNMSFILWLALIFMHVNAKEPEPRLQAE